MLWEHLERELTNRRVRLVHEVISDNLSTQRVGLRFGQTTRKCGVLFIYVYVAYLVGSEVGLSLGPHNTRQAFQPSADLRGQ